MSHSRCCSLASRWMWLGWRGPHPITCMQLLFTGPWGKSEQCWVDAGAGTRLDGWRGACVGGGRTDGY